MGTQFWWFYDVLIVTIAAGLLYNALVKGFNKLVFQLVGFVLAFVIGFFGSRYLAAPTYRQMFQENVISNVQTELETMDLFETMASVIRQKHPDSEYAQADKQTLIEESLHNNGGSAVHVEAAAAVIDSQLSNIISPYPQQPLQDYFTERAEIFGQFISSAAGEDYHSAAICLADGYFSPYYQNIIRMVLFLLLEVVVLIIVGIISGMAGDLEQFMHIRRFDRALAVPVGLIEIACVLISFVVAVKLIVAATDNMMLLFNEETISETKIFQLLYQYL